MWNAFYDNVLNTSILEIIAVIFGLLSVWYARKEHIWVYPTGIISVLIYIYICFFAKLYADMSINAFYFGMSVYGWYKWTHPDENKQELKISSNTKRQQFLGILITLILLGIIYYVLSNYTDSDVPLADAVTTSIFFVGMYFMALKKIENWIYWIVADVISVPLYFYKGLVFTSFQFLIFLVLAVLGLLEWQKRLKQA